MNDPYLHDRLINQINRSEETLAACERTMQVSHAMLDTAHRQLERSRALQHQLDYLNSLQSPDKVWRGNQDPSNSL